MTLIPPSQDPPMLVHLFPRRIQTEGDTQRRGIHRRDVTNIFNIMYAFFPKLFYFVPVKFLFKDTIFSICGLLAD